MFLDYKCFDFSLLFEEAVVFSAPYSFIIRSVLGYQLRKLCCIAPKTLCQDCLFLKNCAYASLFESILEKTNDVLAGRNRASHPYTIQIAQNLQGRIERIQFRLLLFGEYIRYFPYVYVALLNAGKEGLTKTRTKFSIESVVSDGEEILLEENKFDANFKVSTWKYNSDPGGCYKGEVLVQLLSPLRFKLGGKYTGNFEAKDFISSIERRVITLCSLYGRAEDIVPINTDLPVSVTARDIKWCDINHYSARQKKAMKLGGGLGNFTLSGEFSDRLLSLLEFAELFQLGKNTNFGLGQVKIWNKTVGI